MACDPGSENLNLSDCLILNNQGQTVGEVYSQPASIANVIIRNTFVISGVIIFFFILLSGFQLIANQKDGLEQAKKTLTLAITGLVIMISAYWIVQIFEVVLGTKLLF